MAEKVTGHYWTRNVYAVGEWATKWLNANQDRYTYDEDSREPVGLDEDAEAVIWVEEWCRWWLESDPGDAGRIYGAYERREGKARERWPEAYAIYKRLADASA